MVFTTQVCVFGNVSSHRLDLPGDVYGLGVCLLQAFGRGDCACLCVRFALLS